MSERWLPIVGYEGRYEVSDNGDVRSLINNRILKKFLSPNGYLKVSLCQNGKAVTKAVHRLVIVTFLGLSELQVDHKNSIKDDNRLENLEYVTHRENNSRYWKSKRVLPLGAHPEGKKFRAKISQGNKNINLGKFDTPELAHEAYKAALRAIEGQR